MRILGLMSGTSCDGLDCIDVTLNLDKFYNMNFTINDFSTMPYSSVEKSFLLSLRDSNHSLTSNDNQKVTNIFIKYINSFMEQGNNHYDALACHGHTVKHIDRVVSVQLISAEMLHGVYEIPIIYNFRELDISNGGNGAPLMPFLDYLLFQNSKIDIVTLNIGGISNISYIPKSGNKHSVIGFDTGPGMSLVDKATEVFFDQTIDEDAIFSRQGSINDHLLEKLMKNDYIKKNPPKSTDIDEFGYMIINKIKDEYDNISSFDIIRTLVQFTIDSIKLNIDNFIKTNSFRLVYSGGGTEHPIILDWLNSMPYITESISKYGIDSSIKESLLMASLGIAKINNIPSNMPSVTGAINNIVLGDIYEG